MKKIRNKVIIAAFLTATLFSSCEVGLGSSIDKESPTIKITYPSEASVVKGSFVLAGECLDDQEVKSVNVEVFDSNDIQVGNSLMASVNGNSWSVRINVSENPAIYKDGRYTFKATAVDGAYRTSSVSSTSLDLDNTAPVLILSNPQTVDIDDCASFGKTIKIAGDISEEHSTSKVTLYAQECDKDGNLIPGAEVKTIYAENPIAVSTDNPLVFADINNNATDAEKTNYESIYGTYLNGGNIVDEDKYFKVTFKLSDNAKVYVNPGDSGTGDGNESTEYYINNTNFNNYLLSEDTYNFTATKVRKYLNKTLAQSIIDAVTPIFNDQAKNDFTIESATVDSEQNVSLPQKALYINVNPTNSPRYEVTGYEKQTDGEFKDQYLNDDININIEAGKDSIKIDPSTIAIKVKRTEDGFEKTLCAQGSFGGLTGTSHGKSITIKNDSEAPADKYFIAGKSYEIIITGEDEAGNSIGAKNGKEYGFKIFTNSDEPILTIDSVNEYYSGKTITENGIEVTFTVKTAGTSTGLEVTAANTTDFSIVEAQNNEDLKIGSISYVSANNYSYKYKVKIGGSGSTLSENGKQKYTYTITVKDSVGKSDKKSFSFYVDKEDPVVTFTKTPAVEKEENDIKYINGEISFAARISDNVAIKSAKYTIKIGDSNVSGHTNKSYTSEDEVKFDTFVKDNGTLKYDGKDLKVVFTVVDTAGNTKTEEIGPFKIDQNTDKPVIKGQNFKEDGEYKENVFQNNGKLLGTITDADGIKEFTYKIGNNAVVTNSTYISGQVYTIPLPTTSGQYDVKLTAIDKTYDVNETDKAAYRKVEKTIQVAVDKELPKLAITSIGGDSTNLAAIKKHTTSVVYEGTASDDWALEKIEYKVVSGSKAVSEAGDSDWVKPSPAITPDSDNKWTYTVDLSSMTDGNYTVFFKATDKAGKSRIVNSYICKDATNPVLSNLAVSGTNVEISGTTWYKTKELNLSATVTDATSGVASVEYSLDKDATNDKWIPLNIAANGTVSGIVTKLTDNCTIYVRAKDNSGNCTANDANKIENIRIDTDAPTVAVSSFGKTTGNENIYNGQIVMNGSTNIIVKGTVTDAGVGVAEKIKINGTDVTPSSGNWTYTLPETTASGTIQGIITDKLGNGTGVSVPLFQVVRDSNPPKVEITKVVYEGTDNSVDVANGNITFEGIANDTDNYGISAVKLQYSEKNKNTWTDCGTLNGTDLLNWSITVDVEDTTKFTDTKTYEFRAVATDIALNTKKSDVKEFEVNKDSDRPQIKFSFDLPEGMATTNPAWLVKTKTLSYSVTDDDGTPTSIKYDIGSGYTDGSSGKITLTEDKIYTIKFEITDKAGSTFESSKTLKPKLVGENGVNTVDTLYLGIDETLPEYTDLKFHIKDDVTDAQTGTSYWITSIDNRKTGGNKNTLKINLKASDANGVKEVYIVKADDVSETTKYPLTCKTASHTGSGSYEWETADENDIDVSTLSYGSNAFAIKIRDNAGLVAVKNINVNVDNDAPVLAVTSPAEGNLIGNEFTLKGTVTGSDVGTKFKLYVGSEQTLPADFDWTQDADEAKNIFDYTNSSISSWRVYVDGATAADTADGIHIISHKKLFLNAYKTSKKITEKNNKIVYNNENGANSGKPYSKTEPLYFFFRVEDSLGNANVTSGYKLNIDPQGDLPTVEVTSPERTETGSNYKYSVLSGSIRLQGNAEAKEGKSIKAVYMQIDPNYNYSNGFNSSAWSSKDSAKALKGPINDNNKTIGAIYGETNIEEITELADGNNKTFAIKIGGENTSSWNYEINRNDEFIGAENSSSHEHEVNIIAVRLIAVDSSGNVTLIEPKNDFIIHIDTEAPGFGITEPFYVYQFAWKRKSDSAIYYTKTDFPSRDDNKMYTTPACDTEATGITFADANFTKNFRSQVFENDMWLKGIWWLKGSVEDENGISQLEIKDNGSANFVTVINSDGYVSDNTLKAVVNTDRASSHALDQKMKGYIVYYKVGSGTGAGNLSYEFKATDKASEGKSSKNSSKSFSINYDNIAPEVEPSTGDNYDINASVVNSDGYYSLGSAAYEEGLQSGFARTVFFFTKDYATNQKIYDSYIKKDATGNAIDYSGKQDSEDHLYYVTSTIDTDGIDANKVILTSSENNLNIHKGSLLKLAGAYYKVTKVTRSEEENNYSCELELDKNPASDLSGATVKIAIGNVVDKDTKEKLPGASSRKIITDDEGYGYFDIANNDDFMVESAETVIGTTYWSAKINSNTIPDGPAVLHYVVFDNAGNVSTEQTVNVLVKNNAPRFASLHVWCDYDGSGAEKATGEESADYYVAERTRRIKDANTGNVSRVSKSQSTTDNMSVGLVKDSEDSFIMVAKDDMYFVPEIVGGNGALYYDYRVGSAGTYTTVSTSFGSGEDYESQYKEDENGDPYYDGKNTSVIKIAKSSLGNDNTTNVPLTNDKLDDAKKVYLKIWDSALGSTLRNESQCLSAEMNIALDIKVNDTGAPTVKVNPLEWTDTNNNSLYKNNKAYGHIELKKDLNNAIKNTKKNGNGTALGNDDKVSGIITIRGIAEDYNRIGELQVKFESHSEINDFTKAATYSGGVWTSASADDDTTGISNNMKKNGWTFSAKDVYNNRIGHRVEWECNIDTSFITNCADIDQTFEVKAIDTANNANGSNNNTMKVDVVPYVYRLETSLSSADTQNPSIYDRSSSGHYPVYQGEKIKIVGFNFAKNNAPKEYTVGTSAVSGTFDPSSVDALKVNGIPVLNNINKDKAGLKDEDENDESKYQQYAYNRCANGKNNNKLTDDLYLDVWKINPTAATPSDNMILDAIMKINPSTGNYGFAYCDGNLKFAMPTDSASSAVYVKGKDFFTCTGFAYDASGNAWGLTLGGENGDNYGDGYFLLSSLWGRKTGKDDYAYLRANNVAIEANTQRGTKGQTSGTYSEFLDKKRFVSGSIATSPNNESTEYVNIAYFDRLNGEIRFRTGVIGASSTTNGTILQNYTSLGTSIDFDSSNNLNSGKYDATQVQILADANGGGLGYAGEYLSIGTLPSDGHVIITWYDSENKELKYSYKTAAGSTYKGTNVTDWQKWSGKGYTLLEHAGEYCQLAVDKNDGIHIACYDSTDMSLKYVYIQDYTKPDEAVSCTVDSYLKTGMHLTIDVTMVEKKDADGNTITVPKPYIGFWRPTPSRAHYAYLIDPQTALASGGALDGVTDDKFTGVWEVTVVPTSSSFLVDDYNPWRVNVGVHTDTTSGVQAAVANGPVSGSKNAVLGYIVESSTLGRTTMEVAQLTGN